MGLQNYRFVWKRAAGQRWYAKNLMAASPAEAVRRMAAHLARMGSFDQLDVDHFFYRDKDVGLIGGQQVFEAELLTLLNMTAPFHVVYRNQTWAPGAYPAYPSSAIAVAN